MDEQESKNETKKERKGKKKKQRHRQLTRIPEIEPAGQLPVLVLQTLQPRQEESTDTGIHVQRKIVADRDLGQSVDRIHRPVGVLRSGSN